MLGKLIKTIRDDDTIWVMENRENSDRIFRKYISDKVSSSSYAIVSSKLVYVFVHKLDEVNVKTIEEKYSKVYVYNNFDELKEYINSVLKKLNYPGKILLSYTTMSDENTDILTHSAYLRITRFFRRIYKEQQKSTKFSSSELNIYDIISQNSNIDIERLKILASATDEILKRSFYSIKHGDSEIDISNKTQNIMKEYMDNIKSKYDIIDYDFAWDICPIVLVGENLQKGGHAIPSQTKIKPGDTIYYDFGVKAIFNDGTVLYTDMQRMGYMLKENEKQAPSEVMNVFNTLVSSIENGIKQMKPGIKGYKIDKIVRGKIIQKYNKDYPHATGHPVGHEVHGAGALISIRGSKRANLKLVETGVYTLEPRIDIPNGGSIEEMIQVTKSGGIPLCNTQNELYLI